MKFIEKFKLENLKLALIKAWQRMPVAVLLIVITTGLFLFQIYAKNLSLEIENILNKSILTFISTFFLSVGISYFYEAGNFSKKIKYLSQIDSLIFAGLFYYFFEENLLNNFYEEIFIYIIITMFGVVSFIYIAPFLQKWLQKENTQQKFFDFTSLLTLKTIMSVIVGLASMLLGFAGLGALFTLFDLNFINEGNLFETWSVLSLSFLAPIFFLINLPQIGEKYDFQNNKFYLFLVNYLGLTAIIIYFVILYAYTVKVLINFSDWPQGKISWLVIGFSIFGYLIYFATYIFKEKFSIVQKFRIFFPILVIPQVAMLFYAIFLRINQHDWTINRYLVVAFGVWLIVISIYYIFSKKKYLGFAPSTLTIFIIFISFAGPYSVYVFPEYRQQNKLKNNLELAHILEDGQIIPLKKYNDIDRKLSGEIYGSIEYLCRFHGCQTLNFIFESEIKELKKQDKIEFEKNKQDFLKNSINVDIEYGEYRGMSSWEIIHKLTEKIKVKRYWKNSQDVSEFLYFSIKPELREQQIIVTGFNKLIYLNNGEELDKINLNMFEIEKKVLQFKERDNLELADLNFEIETEKYIGKVQFYHLEIKNPKWKGKEIDDEKEIIDETIIPKHITMIRGYQDGYLLLKEKK